MKKIFLRNPIFLLVARGWQYADRYRPWMVFYLVLFVIAQVVTLFEPYIIGRMLNAVQVDAAHAGRSGAQLWKEISFCLWVYFWIQFVFWLFHGPGRVVERYVAFHIGANYKAHLFKVVTQLPIQWHRQHHSGESIDKINRATTSLAVFFDSSFEVSYMIFRLLGSLVVLFWFMPFAGWVALSTTAVAFLNVFLFDRYLYGQYSQLNRLYNRVAAAVHDYVSNIGSVITLRLENRVLNEVVKRMFASLPLFTKNITIHEFKWFIVTMLIGGMTVGVLFHYGATHIAAGQALLGGTFYTLFSYLQRIGDSFYNFSSLYGTVVKQAADVESADTIVAALDESASASQNHALPGDWKLVQIDDLHFRYEDEKHRQHHLENISLCLQPGKAIAFVGESGSGKSTLLSLLRGLQTADRVQVICDGRLLPGKLEHLTSHTTLIPQDPEIFADTISFNITFGLESTEDDLMWAVKLARFEAVLARLPHGLQTNIAEKGVNLSGGEKQRLALARGIFFARESDILLLDEPTSSVDTLNERLIYGNILTEFRDKCVISSVHKLHLLELFDQVYVFDNGQLTEQGTFSQLVAAGGRLAAMWKNYQASAPAEVLADGAAAAERLSETASAAPAARALPPTGRANGP